MTDEQNATLARLADGQTVTAWVHQVVLATATPRPADQVLLAEMLALRTIVLNLLFALANNETPTVDAMKRLIERVDNEKARKALDSLVAGPTGRTR